MSIMAGDDATKRLSRWNFINLNLEFLIRNWSNALTIWCHLSSRYSWYLHIVCILNIHCFHNRLFVLAARSRPWMTHTPPRLTFSRLTSSTRSPTVSPARGTQTTRSGSRCVATGICWIVWKIFKTNNEFADKPSCLPGEGVKCS